MNRACSICGAVFPEEKLAEHTSSAHMDSTTPDIREMRQNLHLKCPICHQPFARAEEVRDHIQQAHHM